MKHILQYLDNNKMFQQEEFSDMNSLFDYVDSHRMMYSEFRVFTYDSTATNILYGRL